MNDNNETKAMPHGCLKMSGRMGSGMPIGSVVQRSQLLRLLDFGDAIRDKSGRLSKVRTSAGPELHGRAQVSRMRGGNLQRAQIPTTRPAFCVHLGMRAVIGPAEKGVSNALSEMRR